MQGVSVEAFDMPVALDREGFSFLLVNANTVVELALLRVVEELEASRAPCESLEADGGLEALVAREMARRAREGEEATLEELIDDDPDFDACPATGRIDVERYVRRIYRGLPKLEPRLERAFSRANLARIAACLADLPADLPRLTARLSAADVERWLAVYQPGSRLGELLGDIRELAR
jgi:hypothetical protein